MRPPEDPTLRDAAVRDAADRELLHPALADGGRPLEGARLTELPMTPDVVLKALGQV